MQWLRRLVSLRDGQYRPVDGQCDGQDCELAVPNPGLLSDLVLGRTCRLPRKYSQVRHVSDVGGILVEKYML